MLLIVIVPVPDTAVMYPTGTPIGIIAAGVVATNLGSDITRGQAPFKVAVHFIYCLLGQISRNTTFRYNVSAPLLDDIVKLPLTKVLVIVPTGCVAQKSRYGVTSVILESVKTLVGVHPVSVQSRTRYWSQRLDGHPQPVDTNGSPGVPLHVILTQSTDIFTTGFNGSVLSVSSPVTEATNPLLISVIFSTVRSVM